MVHTVIFDVGGTLLGAPDLYKNLADLYSGADAYDMIKTKHLSEYISIGNGQADFLTMEDIIRKTLSTVSYELDYPDVSMKAKEVYSNTFVEQSYLFSDTINTLESLRNRNIKMVIASDGDIDLLYGEFKLHGLGGYFSDVFISSEVKAYKPNDMFVSALKNTIHMPYKDILFVGDSDCDIITGKKLGVQTVLKGSLASKSCTPDYVIMDLKELVELIDTVL